MDIDYPVELTPPDIRPYAAGNTGVDHVTRFDSGVPGPHALIMALTHGNEICGAIALDFLFREGFRPTRGVVTLGFANTAAYARFDPQNPSASRFVDEDLNRVWGVLDGPRDSVELRRARALRPVVDAADYLLDIHSMQHATAPLQLAGPLRKGRAFATQLGYPRWVMCDEGHASGRRMRDYGAFGDAASPKNALLIECGQHWERSSAEVAVQTTLHFLRVLGLADPAWLSRHLRPVAMTQTVIEVTEAITVRGDRFAFVEDYVGMEIIPAAGTLLGRDGELAIRTPYDNCVLIMPSRRLHRGNTAVRLGRIVA